MRSFLLIYVIRFFSPLNLYFFVFTEIFNDNFFYVWEIKIIQSVISLEYDKINLALS